MDEQDFLDFGLCLNNANDETRLDNLIAQIQKLPDDEHRLTLLDAAQRKRNGRFSLCSQNMKDRLIPLAKSWCTLGEQRETYKDVLAGTASVESLNGGKVKTLKFHQALIEFTGSEDPLVLVQGLLRVQEATEQFLEGQDGKQKVKSAWSTLKSIKTVWPTPAA